MTQNQLKYFIAAAENHSFTKAAEQYYISQTAITQQMHSLEQTLGCLLFDRTTRPVSLTPAGQAFLVEARAILGRMTYAIERVQDASTGLQGSLHIGYVKGYEKSNLSAVLRRFHRHYTNIWVSCFRNPTDLLAVGLLNHEYDLIFTWDSTNLRQDSAIEYRTVERAGLMVALYPSHPFAQHRQLRRNELRGEPLLYMSPSAAVESFGDSFFMELYKESGYNPNIRFRSSDAESILMMVAAEEGISILPEYYTHHLDKVDNLVFVPLCGEEETEEILLVWRKDNHNPALRRFLDEFFSHLPPE